MGKNIHISSYSSLSDSDLIDEARRLRYGIDNPQLQKRDHLSNLFLSIIGAGTTVATAATAAYMFWKPSDSKDLSIKNIKTFLGDWQDDGKSAYNQHKSDHKNFVNTLLVGVSSFALATLVSMPIIYKYQRKEKAEDNSTKLSHAERILAERGYEVDAQSKVITR